MCFVLRRSKLSKGILVSPVAPCFSPRPVFQLIPPSVLRLSRVVGDSVWALERSRPALSWRKSKNNGWWDRWESHGTFVGGFHLKGESINNVVNHITSYSFINKFNFFVVEEQTTYYLKELNDLLSSSGNKQSHTTKRSLLSFIYSSFVHYTSVCLDLLPSWLENLAVGWWIRRRKRNVFDLWFLCVLL